MSNGISDKSLPVSPGSPVSLDTFFRSDFVLSKRRLHLRYTGFWTEQIARQVLQAFRSTLQAASTGGRPFTLLDDFREWPPQPQDVVEIANGFVGICREFSIARNAMVIPSALVRMQVRRTVANYDVCEAFKTYEEADRWLVETERKIIG